MCLFIQMCMCVCVCVENLCSHRCHSSTCYGGIAQWYNGCGALNVPLSDHKINDYASKYLNVENSPICVSCAQKPMNTHQNDE